jgi:Icc-related predicted phosphoesterase
LKILCISDFIDPLVYTNNIKQRFGEIDLILSAGDLPLDYLDFIISSLNKPLLFVFGNHHIKELKYFYRTQEDILINPNEQNKYWGAVHADSKILKEENLLIMGLGGCIKYNKGKNQFSDQQMYFKIVKLLPKLFFNKIFRGRYVDILLTHAPPKGIHDKTDRCHQGFKAFLWFIKKFKPKFLIHGHIHLYDYSDVRITQFENTTVINAYSHYVLNL